MSDPILEQRARIARLASLGQRLGYLLFGVAIVAFFVGLVVGYGSTVVTVVIVAIVAGSLVLAPSIVAGYGVRAADREDRERGVA